MPQQFEEPQPQGSERFNESVLRVLCLNQAIDKMQKETALLFSIKDQILSNLQTKERMSSKLENFIFQMRMHGEQQQPDPHQHPMSEFDNNFSQIDKKLNNMMNYMNKFFTSLPKSPAKTQQPQPARSFSGMSQSPTVADVVKQESGVQQQPENSMHQFRDHRPI